jgi:hypothetical protein
MKNSKRCSKCSSYDVVRAPGRSQGYGIGNNISVGFALFSQVVVTKYVCCSCGFIEDWVDNPHDLAKIKKQLK